MELDQIKEYLRVDYDDDDSVITLILNAVLDELQEMLPSFERASPTNRQQLLICAYVKDLYDNRGNVTQKQEQLKYSIQSLLLQEKWR